MIKQQCIPQIPYYDWYSPYWWFPPPYYPYWIPPPYNPYPQPPIYYLTDNTTASPNVAHPPTTSNEVI